MQTGDPSNINNQRGRRRRATPPLAHTDQQSRHFVPFLLQQNELHLGVPANIQILAKLACLHCTRATFLRTILNLTVLMAVVRRSPGLRDESPPTRSHEILWEGLGHSGVFGLFVMDTMIHAAKGQERLCG